MTDPQPSKPELLPEERLRLENRWRKADGGMARVSRADETTLAEKAKDKDEARVAERATLRDRECLLFARYFEQIAKQLEPACRKLATVHPQAENTARVMLHMAQKAAAQLRS